MSGGGIRHNAIFYENHTGILRSRCLRSGNIDIKRPAVNLTVNGISLFGCELTYNR